jgi:serine protease DegQ
MTDPPVRRMTIELFAAIALCVAATTATLGADADALPVASPKNSTPSLAPILKKITPAVVSIETRGRIAPDPKSRRRDSRDVNSFGSGVVYDAQRGFIVTNNHVLENANDITVTLTDGRKLKAKRIGGDPDFDLAVISVPAEKLTAISFGDSRQLEVGDFVLAIGYPGNIGQSVTSGIVSGLHRSNIGVEEFENFIQTDAAIYPGNPAVRSSICTATSSASIPPSSARPTPIPAWASRFRSTLRASSPLRSWMPAKSAVARLASPSTIRRPT